MKRVAIIILNWNGKENTLQCLESIENSKLKTQNPASPAGGSKLVVVDNGSNDNSVVAVKSKFPKAVVIENEKNLGFAGGNNVGIRYALRQGIEYLVILNNDTLVDKNLVKELIDGVEANNKVGIVAPKIYFAKGFEFHKGRYKKNDLGKVIWYAGGNMDWDNVLGSHRGVDEVDTGQYSKIEETDFASGCCMLVRKEVFEAIGLFDEKYFLYYEDSDLSEKAKRAGFTIMYNPNGLLWHKNAESVGGSGSTLQDYYITRNRLLFGMRFAPFRSKQALLRESIDLFLKGRPWQKRGVLDFYLRRFGKGSYA